MGLLPGAYRLVIHDGEDRLLLVLGWVGVERWHWGMLGGRCRACLDGSQEAELQRVRALTSQNPARKVLMSG
jgi:hypothetical protein